MTEYKVITEGIVNVFITSNCNSFTSEKKFNKDLTVAGLKNKLELITGASALSMTVEAFDKNDKKVCDLSDPDALLGSFPVDSGMRLQVNDTTKDKGEFEDTGNVEKYELSAEEYSKKTNTVQSFLKRNNLGKYNEEEMKKLEEEKAKVHEEESATAKALKLGSRCEARVPGHPPRRGEVKWVGESFVKPGFWVGIQYDEPYGKNDGSVEGRRFFTCPDKYGGFVKLSNLVVGDFPELGLGSDDEI